MRRRSTPVIVVAGLGRCGTTYMMSVINRSRNSLYYPHALFLRYVRKHVIKIAASFKHTRLNTIRENSAERKINFKKADFMTTFGLISQGAMPYRRVYKTHGYPFPDIPLSRHIRVIWMFGDPMMIALSLYSSALNDLNDPEKKGFNILHYKHLESPYYENRDEILTRDTCLLERHFDAWYRPHAFPFLSLRYEALKRPQVQQVIADFVGFPLQFRPWKTRSTKWQNHPRRTDLEATYGRLQAKVEAAEDVKIWPAEKVRPEWQKH